MNETPIITAFLDANVLYPALLRDILLRLASRGAFYARWSAQVQNEWISALAGNRPDISHVRIERTRHLMDTRFQGALVEGYEHHIEALALPDADDRHVLAAAIYCRARIIVTTNLRDFPASALAPFSIEACHPDAFIFGLLENSESDVVAALRVLRASFKNPPLTAATLLAEMSRQGLAASADALAAFADSL